MKSSFIRTSAAAGIVALAGLAITACSPSLENPSDLKVETATEFQAQAATGTTTAAATGTATTAAATTAVEAAADAPSFIDCVAAPAQTPETVTLNCADSSDLLVEIEWDKWEADEATGTGTRETVDAATGETTTEEEIDIVLTAPISGVQGLVFSAISVDGQVVNP
ncbi:hypothetical protein COCCU_04605 [Corynebacterium occultum]|uniref:Secreted protein n=1 Tax=Corynebacterium occultum TaxID=2675219 RepID=A0A6B8W4L4_9CORY|nr:hypothetical protein [Corynebacterium occultum]QGU06867.1 hypothetical protein COCCU_04605 [Corynebacterium occultum]